MYATILYRAFAPDPAHAQRLIAQSAALIRRPNSGHAYSAVIGAVFSYASGGPVAALIEGDYGQRMWDAWRVDDSVQTQAAFCALARRARCSALMGPLSWALAEADLSALREVSSHYERAVDHREAERSFLRQAEETLRPLVERAAHTRLAEALARGPFHAYIKPAEAWTQASASWRWIKRHTTATSFPFIRLGVDIYKAFAYEVGQPTDPTWYALVRYHY
jgi:hypothetical protein